MATWRETWSSHVSSSNPVTVDKWILVAARTLYYGERVGGRGPATLDIEMGAIPEPNLLPTKGRVYRFV